MVFDNESKAYEGKEAILQLDKEGSISVYGHAVVAKHADGTATVKQGEGPIIGTLVGTSLGSVIGRLGGPVGVAIGATAGLAAGVADDLNNSRIGEDFIDDVQRVLTPNKVALVAEIEEEQVTRWIPAWKQSVGPFSGRALLVKRE